MLIFVAIMPPQAYMGESRHEILAIARVYALFLYQKPKSSTYVPAHKSRRSSYGESLMLTQLQGVQVHSTHSVFACAI